jgi:hypothetical protein
MSQPSDSAAAYEVDIVIKIYELLISIKTSFGISMAPDDGKFRKVSA